MSIWKRICKCFNTYVNGKRGAVSILLILVLSPLLSVSVSLVEFSRYQNAKQLMEEVIDSAGFSTLANYDTYLEERFGLMALSQKDGFAADQVVGYIDENVELLGQSITVDSVSRGQTNGLFETSVLKQQILENSEISVPMEFASEGLDISAFLEELSSSIGVDKLQKELKGVTDGINAINALEKLINAIEDADDQYKKHFRPAEIAWESARDDFEEKLKAYAELLPTEEELAAERAAAAEEEVAAKEEAEREIDTEGMTKEEIDEAKKKAEEERKKAEEEKKKAEEEKKKKEEEEKKKQQESFEALKTAASTYYEETKNIKKELDDFYVKVKKMVDAMESVPKKLEKLAKSSSDEDNTTAAAYDWFEDVIKEVSSTADALFGSFDGEAYADHLTDLSVDMETLQDVLDYFIDNDLVNDGSLQIYSDEDEIRTAYTNWEIDVPTSFSTKLSGLLKTLNNLSAMDSASKDMMGDLIDIVDAIMNMDGIYDRNLDSVVASSAMYGPTTKSLTAELIISAIQDYVEASQSFEEALDKKSILRVLKGLKEVYTSISKLLASIITWTGEFVMGLGTTIASGPKEWYNNLLVAGYVAYNFPSRTNYDSGESLYGYSYNDIFRMAGGTHDGYGTLFGGTTSDLGNFTQRGRDSLFKGAEIEYVIGGSRNEYENQTIAFFNLYMLRLLLDIGPVLMDEEVSAMAAATGPGAIAVKIGLALAEPMIDTLFLVNGEDMEVPMIKNTVYLTPSGIKPMIEQSNNLVNFNMPKEKTMEGFADKARKKVNIKKTDKKGSDLFNFTYNEHMLIYMAFIMGADDVIERVQNLIQMEAKKHYKAEGTTFNLGNAHTTVCVSVNYTLNPMFHLDALTENSTFKTRCIRCIGY